MKQNKADWTKPVPLCGSCRPGSDPVSAAGCDSPTRRAGRRSAGRRPRGTVAPGPMPPPSGRSGCWASGCTPGCSWAASAELQGSEVNIRSGRNTPRAARSGFLRGSEVVWSHSEPVDPVGGKIPVLQQQINNQMCKTTQ